MPSAYATKVAEAFSAKVMKEVYAMSVFDALVNRDYEGDINAVGSKCNILSLAKLSEKTYDGSDLTADDLQEVNGVLTIDQYKSFYWTEKTLDKWLSYIKEPRPVVVEQTANERKKNVDKFVLGFYDRIAAGNRIGTDYTTGTVAVAATTGVVTGSGTTFTSAMVGKGFTCDGLTGWYRVASYSSATSITIQDDTFDDTAAYTGGAISSGASYTVQANTPIAISGSNIMSQVLKLKEILDNNEVPENDRVLVVPPIIAMYIPQGTGIALNVPAAYEQLVQKGFITELVGFKVFSSARVQGDNTNGWHVIAAQRNWLTFADKVLQTGIEEEVIGNFGVRYKDLYVYGGHVTDNRLRFAAELFCTG